MQTSDLKKLAREIWVEQNQIRTNPRSAIPDLEQLSQYYQGNLLKQPGKDIAIRTREGVSAVLELIQFLKKQSPVDELEWSDLLEKAASDHASDLSQQNTTGHNGSDGSNPTKRIEKYGDWVYTNGENLTYGNNNAREAIIQLLIDDGVSNRGHRVNVFNENFKVAGVGAATHQTYVRVFVLDYAGGIKPKGSNTDPSQIPYTLPNPDPDKPDGTISTTVTVKTTDVGNKKVTLVTQVYSLKDGSKKQVKLNL